MAISSVSAGTNIDPVWGNAVADAINAHEDAWTSYTVTTANFTTGSATLVGRYNVIGKTVFYAGYIQLGSGSSITGNLAISMPVAPDTTVNYGGWAQLLDAGVTKYMAACEIESGPAIYFHHTNSGSNGGYVGATSPFTMANGDVIKWNLVYQAA